MKIRISLDDFNIRFLQEIAKAEREAVRHALARENALIEYEYLAEWSKRIRFCNIINWIGWIHAS
jgi:hypothetical protein